MAQESLYSKGNSKTTELKDLLAEPEVDVGACTHGNHGQRANGQGNKRPKCGNEN
jgi:hypothetical protein